MIYIVYLTIQKIYTWNLNRFNYFIIRIGKQKLYYEYYEIPIFLYFSYVILNVVQKYYYQ